MNRTKCQNDDTHTTIQLDRFIYMGVHEAENTSIIAIHARTHTHRSK